MDTVRTGHYL